MVRGEFEMLNEVWYGTVRSRRNWILSTRLLSSDGAERVRKVRVFL